MRCQGAQYRTFGTISEALREWVPAQKNDWHIQLKNQKNYSNE